RGSRLRDAVRPRARSEADGPVRGDVRQWPDTRLRRPRTSSSPSAPRRFARRGVVAESRRSRIRELNRFYQASWLRPSEIVNTHHVQRRGRGGRREEKPKDFSACSASSAFKRRILVKNGAKPAQPRCPLSPMW